MQGLYVNFNNELNEVRPMHAVNNGPSCNIGQATSGFGNQNGNLEEYIGAGIPYARTHDASFYPKYGFSHTVDVHAIFPDFDKDPYDPLSYDFVCTDHYMDMIEAGGAKIFYRLGSRIEHEIKKYGTLPPKDFKKWAIICEHIIKHYTEGWADGSYRDIEYWEIWNEPDLDADDSINKRNWGGTKKDFFEFYDIAATHLKEKFPHLKIGGPASALAFEWVEDFLSSVKAPLDFFSWHTYSATPEIIQANAVKVRELLDKYGHENAQSILDEWNYVRTFYGPEFHYSRIVAKTAKGAAFNLSSMISCHAVGVDMMMYYDARPCSFNGIFDLESIDTRVTNAYYSFPMFNTLYRLGTEVESKSLLEHFYVMAARNDSESAVIFTHFNDDDDTTPVRLPIELTGFKNANGTIAEIYRLDNNGYVFVESLTFFGEKIIIEREVPNYTSYLIKLSSSEN